MTIAKCTSGRIVELPDGKKGRTYNQKGTINGKIAVYFEGEDIPMLIDPKKLKIIGYIN